VIVREKYDIRFGILTVIGCGRIGIYVYDRFFQHKTDGSVAGRHYGQ